MQLRKFIDAFHQLDENYEDKDVEGVYHREKRESDRGVT